MFQELRNSRSCCKKSCVRYIRKKMLNRCQIILAPVFLHKLYYEYDPNGNITSISIAGKLIHIYEYDECNRVLKETDALGNYVSFEYDEHGKVISAKDIAAIVGLIIAAIVIIVLAAFLIYLLGAALAALAAAIGASGAAAAGVAAPFMPLYNCLWMV